MAASEIASNPFALMTHPEAVLQALEQSERLARLHRRIYRPLDRGFVSQDPGELQAHQDSPDREPDLEA
jgi:hypothetical protein